MGNSTRDRTFSHMRRTLKATFGSKIELHQFEMASSMVGFDVHTTFMEYLEVTFDFRKFKYKVRIGDLVVESYSFEIALKKAMKVILNTAIKNLAKIAKCVENL